MSALVVRECVASIDRILFGLTRKRSGHSFVADGLTLEMARTLLGARFMTAALRLVEPRDSLGFAIDHAARGALAPLQAEYFRNGEFLVLPEFLHPELAAELAVDAHAAGSDRHGVTRRGGALSSFALAERAPRLVELYRSAALIDWISRVVDMPVVPCPESDPHGCAVYDYTRPGDGIGWHFDTSFYRGARFTVLIGLHDRSRSRLECRLHTRSRHRSVRELSIASEPGTLILFDGDSVLHRVTPLGPHERRTVLALEYVSSVAMSPLLRLVSNVKDALQYFGFRGFRRWFQ